MIPPTIQPSYDEELFRAVFETLHLPFLAVDTERVAERVRQGRIDEHSWCEIALAGPESHRAAIVGAWRGLLRRLEPPASLIPALMETPALREAREFLPSFLGNEPDEITYFAIYTKGRTLVWEEATIWPVAYSTLINQLNNIVELHEYRLSSLIDKRRQQLEEQGLSTENVDTTDEATRVMPTNLHIAFASLGAWLGGAVNFQYFASYAIAPQLRNSDYAEACAAKMNYGRATARDMRKGGIVPVPAEIAMPLIRAQKCNLVFGGIPVNELSLANPPNPKLFLAGEKDRTAHAGFLVDKQYRGVFLGRPIEPVGLYGERDVLRDHYEDFYKARRPVDLLRCRQFVVPVYEISSVEEARELVDLIPIRDDVEGIFYRGQTGFYTLDRPRSIKKLLFANSCAIEPSLPTSASRHRHDYDPAHFALRFFLENHILPRSQEQDDWKAAWRKAVTDPTLQVDYAMMALAQHYGLPSHGLDVTTDLDVAAWFATQKYFQENGVAGYRPLDPRDWPKKARERPVIYVFQNVSWSLRSSLHDCLELEEFGLRALRPERQRARFFLGGHSEHQNRLAETIVCVLRLKPADYATACSFEDLFPSPEDDPAYAAMLEFAEQPFSEGLSHFINRFH